MRPSATESELALHRIPQEKREALKSNGNISLCQAGKPRLSYVSARIT